VSGRQDQLRDDGFLPVLGPVNEVAADAGGKLIKEAGAPRRSLTAQSITGLSWVFSGSVGSALLRVGVLAILARLITPEAFGVMSAVVMVCSFAELFGQVGVAPALVQKDEVTREDISTALAVSMIMGTLLGAGLFIMAPVIADLFDNQNLTSPLRLISLIFPARVAGIISSALLQRASRFRALSLIDLGSYVVGYAGLSIVLAFLGLGYWALIWAHFAQMILCNVGYVIASPHSFRLSLHRASLSALLRYGSGFTIARLGNFLGGNVDYLVVSRYLGPAALGFYSRAYYVMQQPTKLIGDVGEQVLFPLFSSIKREKERIVQAYYICSITVFLLTSFIAAQIFVVAPDIVIILLGPGWEPAVVPIQFLIVSLPFRVAWKTSSTLIKSEGSTFLLAVWQWIYAAMVFIAAFIGSAYGINGVSLGVAVVMAANYFVSVLIMKMKYPISLAHDVGILIKCGLMALATGALTYGMINFTHLSAMGPLVRLVVGITIGGAGLLVTGIFLERIFPGDATWIKARLLAAFPLLSRLPPGRRPEPL
jgi:PST family polysaccharide transporter